MQPLHQQEGRVADVSDQLNKTAIVTGGARRIGAAICRHLHACGLDVIIHYHTSDAAAEALAVELETQRPGSVRLLKADLAEVVFEDLVREALAFNDRIDVLINNASLFYPTPLDDLSEDNWQEMLNINLKAPLCLSRCTAGYLARQSGCIINITDIYAEVPLTDYVIYNLTQSGLTRMTRQLARELAPGVRVNAIAPGAILWPEHRSAGHEQAILERIPLQRIGDVMDIARAVEFLINDAGYMTGQVITVDGGRRLNF